jgi:hypothetical protein
LISFIPSLNSTNEKAVERAGHSHANQRLSAAHWRFAIRTVHGLGTYWAMAASSISSGK